MPARIEKSIDPEMLYSKEELCLRTGFKQHAWRMAREGGLRVCEVHNRAFVLGADFIAYVLRSTGTTEPASDAG